MISKQAKQAAVMSDTAAFDPLANLFVAQDRRPPHLQDVSLGRLEPLERALLVIDGTLTHFLEAYRMEPIEVVNLGQTEESLDCDHEWLELARGSMVMSRRVLLKGRHSGRVYASAASLVAPERLTQALKDKMGEMPKGLGRMLLSGRTEQYRELLWYGKQASAELPGEMRLPLGDYCLTRTYRIVVRGRPAMLITEWFELGGG